MAAVAPRELMPSKSVNSLRMGEESSASSASELARPALSRRDTEQILDYYQSEDAGRAYVSPKNSYSSDSHVAQREREAITATTPRSNMRPRSAGRDANGDGHVGRASMESVASSSGGVQRRTSQRSAGGADKRRLAIVEVDSQPESNASSSQRSNMSSSFVQPSPDHNLFARRGVDSSRLGGLALVAPPDAQLSNYTGPSPVPASAPATGITPMGRSTHADSSSSGHHRSRSDAQSRTKASPRDVGIVGTLGTMLTDGPEPMEPPHPERERPPTPDRNNRDAKDGSGALTAPVFQTPRSRSPSPLPRTGDSPSPQPTVAEPSLSARGWTVGPIVQLTPSIGQEKEIGRPVAGPVVLDFSSGQPIIRRSPRAMPSGLPSTDHPPTSAPHQYGERDIQRAGRLPFKPNQGGPSYLHYQPGVHSIAGPLPSPPRHILTQTNSSPPPRPPRLLSPPPSRRTESEQSKKSARIPYADGQKPYPITSLRPPIPVSRGDSDFSITAVSVSSGGSTSDEKSPETSPKTPEESEPVLKSSVHKDYPEQTSSASSRSGSHVREGAFPPSSVFLSHPSQSPPPQSQQTLDELVAAVGEAMDEEGHLSTSEVPPPTLAEPPRVLKRSRSRPNLKRENSWVSLSAESFGGSHDDTSPPSSYPSSHEGSSQVLATNITSDDGSTDRRRASLPAPPPDSQRRFHSLPRTPSLLSMTRPSLSRRSSPSSYPPLIRKAPSSWPAAMNFQEVLAKKSPAERALAYAVKIRELATEETGLRDWLAMTSKKERRETAPTTSVPPAAASSRAFAKHPRHVSRNSMASEVTFPIRPDSYTATDLSLRPTTDMSSPASPPSTLPYPSLAHGVGIRKRPSRSFTNDSSSRSIASPATSSKSIGSGFFASIGRKTSIRKDRGFAPTSPTKLISSRRAAPPPQPRPVKIGAPPTIPGGPRAPPRSAQRHNSVLSTQPEHSRPENQILSMPIRPSLESMESFDRQVEKLSDLLPQADKEVLGSYLRRAYNQDPMLAIGTYLEDEKLGTLRSD